MKFMQLLRLILFVGICIASMANLSAITLRNVKGQVIEAEIVSVSDDAVTVSRKGKEFSILLRKLDEASRIKIKAWSHTAKTGETEKNKDKLPDKANLPASLRAVPAVFEALVREGSLVGGQVAISRGEKLLVSQAFGINAVGSEAPVKIETLFLIASSSKPFALACVLRMMQRGGGGAGGVNGAGDDVAGFELDDEIDQWLPAYTNAKIDGGDTAKRAPRVVELLCHRAGIYSQKVKITPAQSRVLYSFEHTFESGVDEIAKQELLAQPGERFAYSGAGYCVLGRVAELAVGGNQSFEQLLQKNVCKPLALQRTTYFPAGKFDDFATGFAAGKAPHKLAGKHLWPLIGGSLYSTAEEMMSFAQGVAGFRKTVDGDVFLSKKSWRELEQIRYPGQPYSLGWGALRVNKKVVRLSHLGSLQGYRSFIALDRRNKICVAATWTLPSPAKDKEAGARIREALNAALNEELGR